MNAIQFNKQIFDSTITIPDVSDWPEKIQEAFQRDDIQSVMREMREENYQRALELVEDISASDPVVQFVQKTLLRVLHQITDQL